MYRSAPAAVGAVNFLLYASAPLRPDWMPYIRFRAHQSHGGMQSPLAPDKNNPSQIREG